jgi:transcriptional regulator with XRE-family HTH domain
VGNNIRKLRIAKNVTQKEIMEKLHINDTSLSRMEKGKHSVSDEQAIALADFFDVSIDYLLGREWDNPGKTIIKTVDFNFNDVLQKLSSYTNNELYKLIGVIEFIIESRDFSNLDNKKINNEINKHRGE